MKEPDEINNIFLRHLEYFKYLFEREDKRKDSIILSGKIFLTFVIVLISSVFYKITNNNDLLNFLSKSISEYNFKEFSTFILLILYGIGITATLIFSLFVVKLFISERLCNPENRLKNTLGVKKEIHIISKIINDYAVATNSLYEVNNKRAKFLFYALRCLLFTIINIILIIIIQILLQ